MRNVTVSKQAEIKIEHLIKEPNHPRQKSGDLESLTVSIKSDGIINPVTVVKGNEDLYHVIDGYRRVEVAKSLGD